MEQVGTSLRERHTSGGLGLNGHCEMQAHENGRDASWRTKSGMAPQVMKFTKK